MARTSARTLGSLIGLRAPNLFHGEAASGDNLLERDALPALAEILAGGTQGAAVFFGRFLFVLVVIDHDFEQAPNRSEFRGRQLIEQRVGLLAFLYAD